MCDSFYHTVLSFILPPVWNVLRHTRQSKQHHHIDHSTSNRRNVKLMKCWSLRSGKICQCYNIIVYIGRKAIITPSCFFVPVQIFATRHFPSRARSRDLHFSKNLCRFSGFQRRTVCKHCECGKAWIQFSELLNSWSNSKYYHHDHFHGNGLISFPPRHNMANRVQFVLRWWMCVTAAAAVVDGTRVEKHQQLKFDQVYLPVYLRTSVISSLHVLSLSSPSIGLSHNSHDDAWSS